jgi:hypothetical protein
VGKKKILDKFIGIGSEGKAKRGKGGKKARRQGKTRRSKQGKDMQGRGRRGR